MKRYAPLIFLALAVPLVAGCSKTPEVVPEVYQVTTRRNAPEPRYSRLTWAHDAQPFPLAADEKTPYLSQVINFSASGSTLSEAVTALCQTIGYRWEVGPAIAERRISLTMKGSFDEILQAVSRAAGVGSELDHQNRLVRVVEQTPQLPTATGR